MCFFYSRDMDVLVKRKKKVCIFFFFLCTCVICPAVAVTA